MYPCVVYYTSIYVSYIQHKVNIYQCFLLCILTSCIMYPCITMQCDHCVLHQCIIYRTKSECVLEISMYYCLQMECVVVQFLRILTHNSISTTLQLHFKWIAAIAIIFQMDRGKVCVLSLISSFCFSNYIANGSSDCRSFIK